MQGILVGGAGDAGVDGGVKKLRQRADRGGALEGALERHHVRCADVNVVQQNRATAGGALTKAAPVVDHLHALAIGRHEHQVLHALFIDHRRGNTLGVDGASRVELAAIDAKAVTVTAQAGGAFVGGLGTQLGQGIAETAAGQYFAIQPLLLFGAAVYPQYFQAVEMILWDLPQRAVGLGDAGDDLGQGDVGHASAAEGLGHTDGPQAGAGEQVQFAVRQPATCRAWVSLVMILMVMGFSGPWERDAAHRDTRPLLQGYAVPCRSAPRVGAALCRDGLQSSPQGH